ncbi:MAG TPA: hypothetical protein VNM40_03695 [Candidatus Paceibacterota bacterium]|nr:hypothetical protein [Candidatus Paceibacterota bacterium]
MRFRKSVVLVICALSFSLAPTTSALTEPCGLSALTAEGTFFTNYESVEYSPDGNLIYHFRNDPIFASGGGPFRIQWLPYDDECTLAVNSVPTSDPFQLPSGVTHWSIRLASPTQLEVWDDQNEALVTSLEIPKYPSYTRIKFRGQYSGGFGSRFESRTVRMFEHGGEPPQLENQVEKHESCPSIAADGYFFDSYERAEYVDGLLRVHLRLKVPFNDGRLFRSAVITPDETCGFVVPNYNTLVTATAITPHIRYYSFRMTSPTEWTLWDDESDVPIQCTACNGTIPADAAFVSFHGTVVGNTSTVRTTPFPPTIEAERSAPDPVIIIPGILGSERNSDGEWVIDPILHTYDDLIATLDINHYTPGVDLFTFPYNWRKSNVETAVLLKEKIDQVKEICECNKVDLVAHSMGGLVARQYIQSDAYEDDVDQLIFLGTPHLGAPKAYLMWEGGEFAVTGDVLGKILELILEHEAYENGYDNLFSYIQFGPIPSVQELLPVYAYIFDSDQLRNYPMNYPTNPFLENLNDRIEDLINVGVSIHSVIGNTSQRQTIVGILATDSSEYAPLWPHGYPENYYSFIGDHGLVRGEGDNTVPLPSASFVDLNLLTTAFSHNALPTEAQGDVYFVLTGQVAGFLSHEHDSLTAKLLNVKILSPADLLVVAPDGKKIGKENGQAINQIPDAFYTGFNTNTEFITILNPLDGEYKVITQGTDSGSYTVETNYISQDEMIEASFTGNTAPGLITELQVSINNATPEKLEVMPVDTDPPIISIDSPETKDYPRSDQLPIDISASDESGVYELVARLGTTTVPNQGTIDLFFKKLGEYTLVASSTDNVGNATTSVKHFRVVATVESTLSDIDRAYSLGWMTKKVRDNIVKKFTAAVKISRVIEKKTDGKPKGEKLQKVVDKILAGAVIIELNKQRGKGLSEQAYQILKEDVLWLISN